MAGWVETVVITFLHIICAKLNSLTENWIIQMTKVITRDSNTPDLSAADQTTYTQIGSAGKKICSVRYQIFCYSAVQMNTEWMA